MSSGRVFVYRNIRLNKFRVRELGSGVVSDLDEVWLTDVKFHVSQSGRLKSMRDGEPSIHAVVIGTLLPKPPRVVPCDVKVGYNPIRGPFFMTSGYQPIHAAKVAHLVDGKVFVPEEVRWL